MLLRKKEENERARDKIVFLPGYVCHGKAQESEDGEPLSERVHGEHLIHALNPLHPFRGRRGAKEELSREGGRHAQTKRERERESVCVCVRIKTKQEREREKKKKTKKRMKSM